MNEGVIAVRIKLIACKALFREISYLCATSPNAVDVTWMRQGYHNRPEQLKAWLQREIDQIEAGEDPHTLQVGADTETGVDGDFDAIVMGYGLCSNATAGLAARKHRLVIPRAHDCITLLLGSKERYAQLFHELPGCFWYSASWLENARMPGEATRNREIARYEAMGYDEETIKYLLEELGGLGNYDKAAYIRTPFLNNGPYQAATREAAAFYGWQYREVEGETGLLRRMIDGDWDSEDFLVLEPGETAVATGEADIIRASAPR